MKLLYSLSEENYDSTFSAYRFWIELGAEHGGVSIHQLYNDILSNASTRPDMITIPCRVHITRSNPPRYSTRGQLTHSNVHLLLRFITDAELDPTLSAYSIGLHDRLCRESLEQFFRQNLDYIPGGWGNPSSGQLCEFYTRVNLIAHWVNLGYVKLEDVKDHILQSLALQPTVHPHQLNSLIILLQISGATFAAHVDPSVMDRCCDLLKLSDFSSKPVFNELAEVGVLVFVIGMSYEY